VKTQSIFSDWVDAPSCLLLLRQVTAHIWPFSVPKLTSFTLVYCHAICSNTEPVKQNLFGIDPCVPLCCVWHCPLSALMFDVDGFSVLGCASFLL